jgi:protein TonB
VNTVLALLSLLATTADVGTEIQPAKSDEDVWALARKIDTVGAYETYWNRFRTGVHASEALQRLSALGHSIPVAPPAPPGAPPLVFPVVTAPPPPMPPDPCNALTSSQSTTAPKSEEASAYLNAQRTRRLADYRDFVSQFPNGVCRPNAEHIIKLRDQLRASFPPIPGFGPLAAQSKGRMIFTEDDYPASSLYSGEQGLIRAEWDVAEDGVAESCRITQSSGFTRLDESTCRIILRRMRYDPARDENGVPTRSTDHMVVHWVLPPEPPPELQPNVKPGGN